MTKRYMMLLSLMTAVLPIFAYRDRPADLSGKGLGAGAFLGQLLLVIIVVIVIALFSKKKDN